MDTIAALNFGIVIVMNIRAFGVDVYKRQEETWEREVETVET